MIYLLAAVAIAYQFLTLLAVLLRKAPPRRQGFRPFVSVLKPVRGLSGGFADAIRSNAAQRYPKFELLFGFANPRDVARPGVEALAREFSHVSVVESTTPAANGKVGTLIDLGRAAKGDILIVSDSDIAVPDEYLERVVAPLSEPSIGLVTCAYRAQSEDWAGRFEALGVATDFGPSTLLAPFVGVDEFGLGATLAFRRCDLERIGGFEAVADYLADDYQIGHKIHALGLKCVLSEVIVETHLSGETWAKMWRHQVRWSRTIRVSRFGGYLGLPATFATLWALVALLAGYPLTASAILASRLLMAVGAGWIGLGSRDAVKLIWLVPVRDLFSAVVWAVGLFGNHVDWGGRKFQLDPDGRIRPC